MSKTIDERVVEMRFDNKNFESNVATSMSTLDKFKQKLKFDGATKGLEDINSASNKINMSGLGDSVDAVSAKFSALQVVAVTALANITNSAVNAGKNLVSSLSIDQVTAGWQKFSDKTTSVATLVAQGNAIEDVNNQLDRLNWFTDETSYAFTEMVSNIAKFTATGKGLNESVTAMEGIATWAALSGQNASTASRAMYQLSQAMGSGIMRLEDYKSIQNASMDTEEFRQKCIEAGIALGTLKDNGNGTYTSLVDGATGADWTISQFANNLTKELWLTSDVMMEVFNEYSSAVESIYAVTEETGMLASEVIDQIHDKADELKTDSMTDSEAIDAAIKELGYTLEDGSLRFDSFGLKAFEAAQKARTFNDAIESVKDAVSTGWMNTFELLFGDAEQATELWTDLANTLWDVFAAAGEVRNYILEIALNFAKPWASMSEKLKTIQDVADAAGTAADKLEYFQDIVNKVWRGDYNNWGDNPDRRDLLKAAGYDDRVVQELVNKGYQYKLTVEDVEAAHEKFGLTMEATTEETEKTIDAMTELSDEQLEQIGLTEDEIALYRALEKEAKRLGISVSELAEDMSTNDGRTLLIDSFKNLGSVLLDTGAIIKEAFADIFDIPGAEEIAVRLYSLIKSFNTFTETLRLTDKETGELTENGEKLKRTFKGIWAVVDLLRIILGGGLKIAFEVLKAVLDSFDMDILDVTANIGDALVSFRDWVFETNVLAKVFNTLITKLPAIVKEIKAWFDAFKETPAVQKLVDAINAIREAFTKLTSGDISLSEFASSLGANLARAVTSLPGIALQIGKDFIAGFQNGIDFSVSDVISKIVEFCLSFVDGFKEALGVQSPSWKAYETATDFFQGFINGASAMIGTVVSVLKSIGSKIVEVFKSLWDYITDENGDIEWGKLFAGGAIVGMILALKQLADAFSSIAGVFDGVSDLLSGVGKTLKSFSKVLNGVAWDLKAQAMLKMAGAIAILVAAIWVLTKIDDPVKLWEAVGIIVILAGVLIGLSVAMDKLGSASVAVNGKAKTLDIKGLQNSVIQIGLALLLMAAAVKLIGNMDADEMKQGFLGLAGMAVGMIVFIAAIGKLSKHDGDVSAIGSMMKKLAVAMILMAVACKLIGMLSAEEMLQGAAFAAGFAIFVIAITKVAKSAGNNVSKVGGMVLKLTVAMILMVAFCKLVGMLSTEEMLKGAAFAAAFVLFVGALVKITKIGKKQQIAQISGLVLSISVSLLMLVGVCKLVGMLTVEEMVKGAAFVAAFVILLKVLVKTLTISNEQQMAKVAGTILAMSAAIAILAAVAILLSFVPIEGLAKGIIAVGLLSVMMTAMIKALKGAQNVKGAIMMMAIAIGVMAASIVALSFVDTTDLAASTGAMVAVMTAFALMIRSLKGIKGVDTSVLITLGVLTAVVAVLAIIIYKLKDVDPLSAISTAGSLAVLMLSMAAVLKILNSMDGTLGDSLKGILALTLMIVPLLAFTFALKQMNGIENAMSNVLVLSALMGVMTVLLAAVSLVGKYLSSGILVGLLSLTAMVVPMIAFIWALKKMDGVEDASGKVVALTTMMTAMTLLLAVLAVVGLGGPAAIIGIGSLVLLFVAIGALAVAIGALMEKFPNIQKFLDTGLPVLEQLAGSIGTMIGNFIGGIGEGLSDSLVKMGEDIADFMDQLAIASDNAAGVKGESFDGVKQLMGVMADIGLTTVGTTIADIFTLGGTSMEKFQTDGVAFFDAMKAISEASAGVSVNEESIQSVIGVAQSLADLQSSLEPIGGVISWFTGRDDLGTFGDNVSQFMTSMVTAFETLDGATFNAETMNTVVDAASSLADLQSKLEPIGGVISWFTGRDDLGTFGLNVGVFIYSIKTAFSSLDGVEFNTEGMNSIVDAATSLANLQSSLEPIGGVITWFTGRDDLGTFGVNVAQFIVSMKLALSSLDDVTFNGEALTSIVTAATDLATLQASLEPIGGVISWFTGRDDLGKFGVNVSQFISSMKTALSTLDGVTLDEEALDSVIAAAEKLSEFQSSLEPMGGVVAWFAGRTDLGTFGTNVGLFADAMGKLKTGMGEDGISETVITSITNAGEAIIALQEALPTEGWFDGKMNLSEFSDYVTDFSTAMATFSSKATEIDTGMVSTCINTAYQIKNLIESLVDIDVSGVETFTGIGTGGFGADGPAYDIACAIAAFSDKVAEIDTSRVTVAVTAAKQLKTLINGLVNLDTSGVEKFKPGDIGDQMQNFSDKVSGIDTGKVSSSISSANRLKNFISGLSDLDTSGINKFKPKTVGSALSAYSTSVSGFNSDDALSSISVARQLKSFISSLAGLDSTGASTFKTAINELSTANIEEMVEAFSSASDKLSKSGVDMINGLIKGMQSNLPAVKSVTTRVISSAISEIRNAIPKFESAGKTMVSRMAGGLSSNKSVLSAAATSCVSRAASTIRAYYSSFYSAGSYLVSGFANGISANSYLAIAKARAMANAAATAAKNALDINSPSKVFRKIGYSVPEGFANGIDRMTGMVKNSSVAMANTALDGTKQAIANIAEMMSTDADYQPTITPVLDLSDVESGAGSIASMFNSSPSVGVNGNLRAIGSMMNQNSQNGMSDEIVSAINNLRKDLGNVGNTTYSINGVTYDDGSNIQDAVSAIVRQARIGRRV